VVTESSQLLTLYQCFLTLPSVLVGKVFAISLQLQFWSRICFNLCSSAGVQGVFVRPFFGAGLGISTPWFDMAVSTRIPCPGPVDIPRPVPVEPGGAPIIPCGPIE